MGIQILTIHMDVFYVKTDERNDVIKILKNSNNFYARDENFWRLTLKI